jgi:hypothetical protein
MTILYQPGASELRVVDFFVAIIMLSWLVLWGGAIGCLWGFSGAVAGTPIPIPFSRSIRGASARIAYISRAVLELIVAYEMAYVERFLR